MELCEVTVKLFFKVSCEVHHKSTLEGERKKKEKKKKKELTVCPACNDEANVQIVARALRHMPQCLEQWVPLWKKAIGRERDPGTCCFNQLC